MDTVITDNGRVKIAQTAPDTYTVFERQGRRWRTVDCLRSLSEARALAALIETRF